jgi:hypothetical protein
VLGGWGRAFRPAAGDGSRVIPWRAAFLPPCPRIPSIRAPFVVVPCTRGLEGGAGCGLPRFGSRLCPSATDRRSTWIIIQCVPDVECAAGVSRYAGGLLYVCRVSPAEPRFRVMRPECGRLDLALSLLSFELVARAGAPAQENNFNELIDSYRNCCIPSEIAISSRSLGRPARPDGAMMATSERRPGATTREHSSSERPAHTMACSYDDIVTPLIHAGGPVPIPP